MCLPYLCPALSRHTKQPQPLAFSASIPSHPHTHAHTHTPTPPCRFHLSEAGVRAIAREARAKGVGARGLRSILEKLLLEAMFHVSGGGWCSA